MRKLIAVVASTAALLIAGMANAAPTEVIFTQNTAGSNEWTLSLNITDPISVQQVAFLVNNNAPNAVADFVITAAASSVDPFTTSVPSGFSVKLVNGNQLQVALVAGTGGTILGGVLGTLSVAGPFQITPSVDDGGLILDGDFVEAPSTLTIVPFPVPEPAVMVLLGLGLAGLGLARRSA